MAKKYRWPNARCSVRRAQRRMPTSQFERLMLRTSLLAASSEVSARGPASSAVAGARVGGASLRVSAGVAQLVERQPSKLNVASSNLVSRSLLFSRGRPNPRGFLIAGRPNPRGFLSGGRPQPRGFLSGGRSARRVVAVCGPAGSRARDFVSRGVASRCLFSRGRPNPRVCPAHLAQLVEHVLGKDEVVSSILTVGSQSGCGVSPLKLRTSCAGGILPKRRA